MSKTDNIKKELKRVEEQMKRTSGLNYHKYNNFVVEKGMELNKARKQDLRKEDEQHSRETATEAAMYLHNTIGKGRKIFIFGS